MPVQEINVELKSKTSLQKFYMGQNILITGGTGFLGKLLIEKLLRSCPQLSTIYVIIRPKKGQDAYQRLDSILDDLIFNRLKDEVPKFRHKIMAISGDCSLPEFGISVADKELIMREISIVFNVAATVRFDEKLKEAVITNINGPMEMMNLCKQIKNLKAVIHVSTAYSNCIHKDIEEKIYQPPITGDNVIKLINSLDAEKLDDITPNLIGTFPNTYTYTKCIAEQVIQQYGKGLPTGIFRPAIITSSYQEPIPGWVGNFYGPTGLIAAAGSGLMKILKLDKNCVAELVPADLTVNALISTAWDVANNKNQDADPLVYNYVSWANKMTWQNYLNISLKYGKRIPSNNSMWSYSITITKSSFSYYFLVLFLHLIPGLIVDACLFITGKEPRLLKIYKKIHKFTIATTYFGVQTWNFNYNNTKTLWKKLSPEDQDMFFFSMDNFDWDLYFKRCVDGIRMYVFKEDPITIPEARKRMARILLINNILKYTIIGLLIWIFYWLIIYTLRIGARSELTTFSESLIIH